MLLGASSAEFERLDSLEVRSTPVDPSERTRRSPTHRALLPTAPHSPSRRMNLDSNYGSSEYSPEAEELFAGYLHEAERGVAGDFEAFCAEHEEFADELYGLHADWDNVRGLLRQLESRRPGADESAPREAIAEPARPDVAPLPEVGASVQAPACAIPAVEQAPVRGAQRWKLLTSAAAVLALCLGSWSAWLSRNSEVLAQEKDDLATEGLRVRAELESTRESRDELTRTKGQLEAVLDTTAQERDQVRDQNESLAQDLESERQAKLELDRERDRLAEELEAERRRQRESEARLLRTGADAARLQAAELMRREAGLWPATRAHQAPMRTWIAEAEALLSGAQTTLKALAPSEDPADRALSASLEAAIQPLGGDQGTLARTRARAAELEEALRVLEEEDAEAWHAVLARLADAERYPALADLDWQPQCGLAPLGPDSDTGLERFADRRTGEPASTEPEGQSSPGALVFVLVPGAEIEGRRVQPFLVAATPLLEAHRHAALGPAAGAGKTATPEELRLLGLRPLDTLEAHLGTKAGLRLWPHVRHPVRPLTLGQSGGGILERE